MPSPRALAYQAALRRCAADPFRRSSWLASVCLIAYYAISASRDLSLYDSGELAQAAVQLGLGHPPGQPLHTLLGHVASRLVPGARLWGVNLVSVLAGGLSLVPAAHIARQLTAAGADAKRLRAVPWLLLVFGVHESLWEPATRVEVYTLATLCALWAIACALPLLRAQCQRTSLLRRTGFAATLLGLSASSNPVIAAASGIALAPGLLRAAIRERATLATLGRALLGGALGLAPYLYLPLVARRNGVMVWGGLNDAASFARYLTLRDYARNQTLGWLGLLEHVGAWSGWSVEHLLAPVLLLGVGGFAAARRQLRFGVSLYLCALALLLAMISFNVVFSLEVPDYNGYLGVAYWLAAAGAAALFASSLQHARWVACAASALCMAGALWAPPAPPIRTRAHDHLARTLAEAVLHEAPHGAIIISFADYFAGSLFYLQEVERQRPDLVVLAYGLSGSSWHWRHLQALHPQLRPVDLRQRGGRLERVRGWLAANAERPVLIERLPLAAMLGLRACPGGLYLRTGALCAQPAPAVVAPAKLLADQLAQLDGGSPGAAGAIAEVSEQLGSALWRLGEPEQAHAVLMAGVPRAAWPARLADGAQLAGAARLSAPPPHWRRAAALGDPARNLYLAGAIAANSGQSRAAQRYLEAAASLALPEALALTKRRR